MESLPVELLEKILNYSDIKTFVKMSRVNSFYNSLCHSIKYDKTVYLPYKTININQMDSWENLKFATIYYHRKIHRKVHRFYSINTNTVKNIKGLKKVKKLKLYNNSLYSMPSLPCLKELDISSTPIIDVSNLGHLTKLSLQNCFNLMDVSFLGKVHTLDLSFTDITDISALGNVHTLNISHCKYIEDFSALGGNHTLDLSFTYIEDVSNLGNVNTLILNCCYRTINISYLRNVKKLKCNNTRFLINK